MDITNENVVQSLPFVLSEDPQLKALAESIADVLVSHIDEIKEVKIFPRLDDDYIARTEREITDGDEKRVVYDERLSEELLNTLAYDFKIDWWDEGATFAEKNSTVALTWYTHRHLGTPAAVQKVIDVYYPGTQLEEWFEYNGRPYHFRLMLEVGEGIYDGEKAVGIVERMEYFKNLRSLLDYIKVAMLRKFKMIAGQAQWNTLVYTYSMQQYAPSHDDYYVDENGAALYDETAGLLFVEGQ